jgi:stage IV sporulation protein FB
MITIPGRIPVTIHPIFWAVIAFLGWLNLGAEETGDLIVKISIWIVVVLVSVLVHEFGHALTALYFKQNASIDLVAFGGLTQRTGPKIKAWQNFLVVLNGPLAGLLLGYLAFLARYSLFSAEQNTLFTYALTLTYSVCFLWTVLNLIPVMPLDGGQLLTILLEGIFGFRGIQVALVVSFLFSVTLGAFFFVAGYMITGSFLLLFAFESFRSLSASRSVSPLDRKDELKEQLREAEQELIQGKNREAKERLEALRSQTGRGVIYVAATQMLAQMAYQQELYEEVYRLLYPIRRELDVNALHILLKAAYKIGKWQVGIELGDKAYKAFPSYDSAIINATCYAQIGEVYPAVGWLQCAVREGLPNPIAVLQESSFDKIRQESSFQKFFNSLTAKQ